LHSLFIQNKQTQMNNITKTEAQKQERWARIAELQAQGRVMTPNQQLAIRNKKKKEDMLQERAERVLNSLTPSTIQSNAPMGTNSQVDTNNVVPEANVILPAKKKVDTLALKADAIIKELQGA
jgi:hypothetical protein